MPMEGKIIVLGEPGCYEWLARKGHHLIAKSARSYTTIAKAVAAAKEYGPPTTPRDWNDIEFPGADGQPDFASRTTAY